jgi:hypothetical protein
VFGRRFLRWALIGGAVLYAVGSGLVYSKEDGVGFYLNLVGLFVLTVSSPFWALRVKPKSAFIALLGLGAIELFLLHSRVISDDRSGIIFLASVVAIPLIAALILIAAVVRALTGPIH